MSEKISGINQYSQIVMKVEPSADEHIVRMKELKNLEKDLIMIEQSTTSWAIPASTSAANAGMLAVVFEASISSIAQNISIGAISGLVTGMTSSISNNNTKTVTVTLSVTTSLTTTNGIVVIPLTINGKTIKRTVSWALARTGSIGNTGSTGTSMWGWNSENNLTNISSVSNSKIGDYFINASGNTRTMLGVITEAGGVVKSTSATAGTAAGTLKAITEDTGTWATFADLEESNYDITTDQFLMLLLSIGAFDKMYWVGKATWVQSSNHRITDTGCGNIQLAGAVIEVIGISTESCVIRITTPTTLLLADDSVSNSEFIYANHGPGTSPGWRMGLNHKNIGTKIKIAGTFYTGTTNPSATNRLNYDGYLYAYQFHAISNVTIGGNLKINGSTKAAGVFYTGTVAPTNTTRLNYDGDLYVMNLTVITAINSATLSTTGNASIGGTLSVTGNSTLNGNLTINGSTKTTGSFYTGTTNPSNTTRLNYDGNLHVNNFVTIGTATIGGVLDISNVPNGIAPLTVTSKTKITNLNADLLDGKDSSAFVEFIPATCSTAAATVLKEITIPGYTLRVGDIFDITYTFGNTANSATISINGSVAIQVRLGGGQPTGASGTGGHYIAANNTALYYYNGTYMCLLGSQIITNTSYSEMSVAEGQTATATTSRVVRSDYLKQIIDYHIANSGKQDAITGGASTITTTNLTANRALLSDASGKVAVSAVTNTQLSYLSGVTSAIQTQINARELASNKGIANGFAGLDANAKLLLINIPDFMLGQVLYAGTLNASTAVATLTTNAQTKLGTANATITLTNNTAALTGYSVNQGNFYIVSSAGTFAGTVFGVGDWLVATATSWIKVDNTDALTGIKGEKETTFRIGNVNITLTDIGAEAEIIATSANDYYRGDKTFQNLTSAVLACQITAPILTNSAIATGDTLQVIGGKLQAQINYRAPLNTTLIDSAGSRTLPDIASGSVVSKIQSLRDNVKNAFVEIDGKQSKVIPATCSTAAATVGKSITIPNYTLAVGDIFAITYTLGNTANSATISINGSVAIQVRLGGGQPTGASGTGGHYIAANNTALYYYNGTYMCLSGSQDITDVDTTSVYNVYGTTTNQYIIHNPTNGGTENYYPFIGICDDGTIEKITATSNNTAIGARTFTSQKISLKNNIMYISNTTGIWTAGGLQATAAFSRMNISTANWKYAIGNYYNKVGVLTNNDVVTDLVQTPLYVGGTRNGDYFIPSEFSLTMRNTSYVYKMIGYFTTAGYFYLSDYQPVFIYFNDAWIGLENLSIMLDTNKAAGVFYPGTTNPSNTTRLNYDGNLHAYQFHAVSNASVGGTLSVTGNTTLSGNLTINGSTKTAGSFYAGAVNPTYTTRLNYDGNLHVMNLTAVITINSATLATTGNASIGGTLSVTGNSILNGNLTINGSTKTAGSFYTGTVDPSTTTRLNYDGNLHVMNLTTTANAMIGGFLTIKGTYKGSGYFYAGTVDPTSSVRLNYDGYLHAYQFHAVSNASVGGTLSVTGNSILNGNLAINGSTKTAGSFYAGLVAPTNTTRLNYDGNLHATTLTSETTVHGVFAKKYIGSVKTTYNVANEKFDIKFNNMISGCVEITLSSTYNMRNSSGHIKKRYVSVITPEPFIHSQSSEVVTADPLISGAVTLSDIYIKNSIPVITISKLDNLDENQYFIMIETSPYPEMLSSVTLSSVYVNTTVYPPLTVSTNQNILVKGIRQADTRNLNHSPYDNAHPEAGIYADFKINTTDGLYDGGTYHRVITYKAWADPTGGNSTQLGLTDNGNLWIRTSLNSTTWGTWERLLKPTDISNMVTLTGSQTLYNKILYTPNVIGLYSDSILGIHTPVGAAQGLNIGQLLVAGSYAANWVSLVPPKGIFSEGQIRSGVANGTAPLVVASATAVTNLNADLLDGYHASNFVPTTASVATGVDLNTVIIAGFYRLNSVSTSLNAPEQFDASWGQLVVCRGGADTITQIIFSYSQNRMAFRSGTPIQVGGAGSYSPWKEVLTDNISNFASNPLNHINSSIIAEGTKIRLPVSINSAKMIAFTVRIYANYNYTDIAFSGYTYPSTNNWFEPKATMIAGTRPVRAVMGYDTDGIAYVWVSGPSNYAGISILDVTSGYQPQNWNNGWGLDFTDNIPNIGLDRTLYPTYNAHGITEGVLAVANGGTGKTVVNHVDNSAGDYEVSKYLRWKNYGSSHTIIDASAGTTPNGTAINNTTPLHPWAPSHPTLMGLAGTATYGVRVYISNYADSANALSGLTLSSGLNNVANQVARTNASGYLMCGYINTNPGIENPPIGAFFVQNTSADGYIRKASLAHVSASLNLSTTINYNTSVGPNAGFSITTGSYNMFVGGNAGRSNTTGNHNISIGYNAGYSNTTGNYNIFIGSSAGYYTTASYNTFIGYNAGNKNTTGNYNTFIGNSAGYANTTANCNTFIGYNAGNTNTTATNNTFIGYNAGYANTTGNYNTFIGCYSGRSNTSSASNTFIGYNAGYKNTVDNNTFIGYSAGYNNDIGPGNTFIGYNAGQANITAGYNTFIGYNAGYSSTANHNTFIGYNAGRSNTIGLHNTFMGCGTGYNNTTGSSNTFIGYQAGLSHTTGSNNIIIGYNASASAATVSNSITLGNASITQLRCQVTTITALSDKRTKEYYNPANVDMCLETIKNLPVYRYKYKNFTGTHLDSNVTGFMADDVEKIFPKSVTTSDRYFPVLDENGEQVYEEIEEVVKSIDEEGNEIERIEKRTVEKMFLMKDVKEITMTEATPTIWAGIQALISRAETSDELINELNTKIIELENRIVELENR